MSYLAPASASALRPTVLITGAGRGIGLTTAKFLASSGWHVYAGARSAEHLASLAKIAHVTAIALDITSPSDLSGLTDRLPSRLDALINNSGIAVQGPVEALSRADIARQLDINVTAQIAVTQIVLPHLRRARGRIVFISSVSGRVATPGTGMYSASKFAIEAIGDTLRVELRPWGIKVVLIEPGATNTDMWKLVVDEFDETVRAMSETHRTLYDTQIVRMRGLLAPMQQRAVSPSVVAARIEHALTTRRPRARYLCDTPSRVQVVVRQIAPTSAVDALLSAVVHGRTRGRR